jgi:hypothetical protein
MNKRNTSRLIVVLFGKKIQAKEIETPFVRSEDQLANIFTKRVEPIPFEANTSKLGLIDIYNPI